MHIDSVSVVYVCTLSHFSNLNCKWFCNSVIYISCFFVDPSNFVKQKPGIRFTEKMVGEYESSDNKGEKIPCEFTLTIESDDVERMLNCDKNHSANISGTVKCSALSSSPLIVSDGMFTASFC